VAREKNPTDEREAKPWGLRVRGQVRGVRISRGVNQDVLCLGTNFFFFSTDESGALGREPRLAFRGWEQLSSLALTDPS